MPSSSSGIRARKIQAGLKSVKYIDIARGPLFPLGYYLSYTEFTCSNLTIDQDTIALYGMVTVSVTIKNGGKRAGEEIVQLYIRDRVASLI